MKAQFFSSIHLIEAGVWNDLCGTDYPFLRHEFFAAMEDSGSTTRETGWQAHHLGLSEGGEMLAVIPLFLKSHSYGEYVFDWSWAEAWHRYGHEYYPKLINAIPFTPSYGPRWGFSNKLDENQQQRLIQNCFEAIEEESKRLGLSSAHFLFHRAQDNTVFTEGNYLQRIGCQYHWLNRDYGDFEDFLSEFTSRKRKSLKRERRLIAEQDLSLSICEGRAITEEMWQQFYQFYQLTYLKRSGHGGYLNIDCFQRMAETLPEHMMMVQAQHRDDTVAAALFFKDKQTLYGRYWGCKQEFDQLHFETCYYQGIEYAIKAGLKRFDPGAQGEHKIQRGFTPIITYSHHRIQEPAFANAIEKFLIAETQQIKEHQKLACERLPFKED
ncbi:MAG: putative N-acyltransferase [Cellvibrionaceae bacterium]